MDRTPKTLTELLQDAISRDGRSLKRIARAGELEHGQLSRFLRNERIFTLPTVEALCDALGVEVRLVRRRKKGR